MLRDAKTVPKVLRIHTYPDPVLRAKAEPVDEIDGEIQQLVDDMAETMYAAPGIGLAANQVGVLKRVIVFDVSPKEKARDLSVLINPEIIEAEGSITLEEACLSILDYSADVTRSERVKVRGLDREGNLVEIEAEGLKAVCLQHEIDHLDGILFIDHISSLKRALYKKRLKKMGKKRAKADHG
ncbi:MAG: peptide deformylase [Deltaproteobacteria bacterium]|nr:peptide deformylase [Deltaproteobacteria bacterium]MBW2015616.1 peptide deformylase [Deltaproteobacteria bacterium]MBW2128115.1 peptide deformylase [Deltaproteobacteria bacterium]